MAVVRDIGGSVGGVGHLATASILSSRKVVWSPLLANRWKLNIDVGFSSSASKMGFGAIIRDAHGNFVVALSSCLWGFFASFVHEAKALVEGLVLAVEVAGLTIEMELYSQILVPDINNRVDHLNNFGLILLDIWYLFPSTNVLSFRMRLTHRTI